jgi:membrane protease YdiL (CAAX protease family)
MFTEWLRSLCFNRHDLIRVVWRLPLFITALLALGFAVTLGMRALVSVAGIEVGGSDGGGRTVPIQILGYLLMILTLFAVSALAARLLDRRAVASLGLGFNSRWLQQLSIGLLLGVIFVSAIIGILAASGALGFHSSGIGAGEIALNFLLVLLLLIGVSFFEELLFRGYVLQVLAEGIGDFIGYLRKSGSRESADRCGKIVAAFLLAAPFGIAHYTNDGGTVTGALATGMAGLLLALAYFRTGSLWLPVGLHTTWNLFLGWVYAATVSGEQLPGAPFETSASGPDWLTGGSFGPEASLLAFIAMALMVLYIYRSRRFDATYDVVAWYPPPGSRVITRSDRPVDGAA